MADMTRASRRLTWRERFAAQAADPIVPFVVGAAVLVLAALTWIAAGLGAPAWRGPAVLGAASVAFLVAFVLRPKPTLAVFALFVLYYHTLGRWLSFDLRHIDEVVVPLLFLITVWRTRPWRHGLISPLRDGALLAMFGAGVVSSLADGVPLEVWLLGTLQLAKVFVFLYVVLWHDWTERDVRQVYPVVLGVAVVTLGLSAWEIVDTPGFRATLNVSNVSQPREGLPSIKSLFAHPVLFAWFNAFVALFLFTAHVYLRRWWLLAAGALFSAGTILSGRRRAIAGLGAALAAGVLVTIRHRGARPALRSWWPSLVTAGLVVLVFLPSLLGLISLTVDETAPDPDPGQGNARIALYETSLVIARDHFPLGVGMGRYASAVSRNPYSPVYVEYGLDTVPGLTPYDSGFATDTYWPRILGETGVLGLVAMFVFVGALARDAWAAARTLTSDKVVAAFMLGAWLVLVQGLVETLASSLFDSPPRAYLLFGALGVAIALARRSPRSAAGSTD